MIYSCSILATHATHARAATERSMPAKKHLADARKGIWMMAVALALLLVSFLVFHTVISNKIRSISKQATWAQLEPLLARTLTNSKQFVSPLRFHTAIALNKPDCCKMSDMVHDTRYIERERERALEREREL